MTLVWLPSGVSPRQIADAGLAPGLMSAGLGSVPAEQTYLDVTQGNRVFDSLYDADLPPTDGCDRAFWRAVEDRADSAPAEIVPGLLQSTLAAAGIGVRVGVRTSCTFSPIPPIDGASASPRKLREGPHPDPARNRFEVRSGTLRTLPALARSLRGDDLLIAVETPPPPESELLAVGAAGPGISGDLTSDSTRSDGYVLSTDVAPTVLRRFGLAIPGEMSGRPIRAEGTADPAGVESLGARLAVISERRGPVIGLTLLAWIVAAALAAAASRGRLARGAVRCLGLAVVYLPLALLGAASLDPSLGAERLLALAVPPLLAAVTLALLGGYRALAAAAAATVLAYATDVVAGSPLVALSLLGPNPGLGVRFYGIGNELEALLAVLVVAGTGAALAGFHPSRGARSRRREAATFLLVGLLFAFVFAAGRFGADVGAAIVLPVGAAVAAAVAAGWRRGGVLLAVAIPIGAVALLALADLVSGAEAHLTRSVLDAGGLGDLAEVAQRRLRLSSHSFARPVVLAFLPLVIGAAALALVRRDRLASWLRGVPALRAGLLGALAATVVGTLANDSGALLLEVGTAYLLVFSGFAWAESEPAAARSGGDRGQP